jgi:hypothetical protein
VQDTVSKVGVSSKVVYENSNTRDLSIRLRDVHKTEALFVLQRVVSVLTWHSHRVQITSKPIFQRRKKSCTIDKHKYLCCHCEEQKLNHRFPLGL